MVLAVGCAACGRDQATPTQPPPAPPPTNRDDPAGWIVDLCGNGGGNMWPIIAGVGSVLGDDLLGFFISPTGRTTRRELRDGGSFRGTPSSTGSTIPTACAASGHAWPS